MLAAAGGATLSGSWTRVFINNEAYGLFLLMDDASTHLIDNILHGGDWKSANTGNLQYSYILNIFILFCAKLITVAPFYLSSLYIIKKKTRFVLTTYSFMQVSLIKVMP